VEEDLLVGFDRIYPVVVFSTLVYSSHNNASERAVVRSLSRLSAEYRVV
jgi:hypothetical protein